MPCCCCTYEYEDGGATVVVLPIQIVREDLYDLPGKIRVRPHGSSSYNTTNHAVGLESFQVYDLSGYDGWSDEDLKRELVAMCGKKIDEHGGAMQKDRWGNGMQRDLEELRKLIKDPRWKSKKLTTILCEHALFFKSCGATGKGVYTVPAEKNGKAEKVRIIPRGTTMVGRLSLIRFGGKGMSYVFRVLGTSFRSGWRRGWGPGRSLAPGLFRRPGGIVESGTWSPSRTGVSPEKPPPEKPPSWKGSTTPPLFLDRACQLAFSSSRFFVIQSSGRFFYILCSLITT